MAARAIPATAALVLAPIGLAFALAASAQTADPVARVFHPKPPLPSYDVATIKPFDPTPPPGGMMRTSGQTVREYIRIAYAPSAGSLTPAQVVGGPEWIGKEQYTINGKPPADLEVAMRQMKTADWLRQLRGMQQSLLADRFHLKVHFEVREMPIYALVPAKGGLRIQAVAYPDPPAPDSPSSPPAPGKRTLAPGAIQAGFGAGGSMTLWARAISMAQLTGMLSSLINQTGAGINLTNTSDRPVVDQTGFAGYFDIDAMKWAALTSAAPSDSPDLPTLDTALEETLGLRLVSAKGPVEVVVIDSIDRPSEN